MRLKKRTEILLKQYAKTMRELRNEGIVRTNNNPVADIGEFVACEILNLNRAPNNVHGYDAVSKEGGEVRYEVKSRRHTKENHASRLGQIRDLEKKLFDYLVVVLFFEDFSIEGVWLVPHKIVLKCSTLDNHTNSHILNFPGRTLQEGGVRKIG